MGPGLFTNADGSTAYAEMVSGARDGVEGRRHKEKCDLRGNNQSG